VVQKRFCGRESGSEIDIVIAFILLGRGREEYGKWKKGTKVVYRNGLT
jgi:hypothetical protein